MLKTVCALVQGLMWIAIPALATDDSAGSEVTFPTRDSGMVAALAFGDGRHGVVLVPGGRFTRESWNRLARALAQQGFRVLAIDLRGRGKTRGGEAPDGHRFDVLAAVDHLRDTGAEHISVVGASFGGAAAAEAATITEIDRLVLLAASSIDAPEKMSGAKLFITTRDDFRGEGTLRLPEICDQFRRARPPKRMIILEGSEHAQRIFETEHVELVMAEIVNFLSEGDAGRNGTGPAECCGGGHSGRNQGGDFWR